MLHGHQIWDNGADVAVIVLWGAIGAAIALWRFRWEPAEG
jgi:hypothetical protein